MIQEAAVRLGGGAELTAGAAVASCRGDASLQPSQLCRPILAASSVSKCGLACVNRSVSLNTDKANECVFSPLLPCHSPQQKRPTGLKYEKAKEWRIPCVNAQWLGDILLGNFEALRQTQYGRYTAFGLQDPFAPTPQLVLNLLGKQAAPRGRGLALQAPLLASGWCRFSSHLLFPLGAIFSVPP